MDSATFVNPTEIVLLCCLESHNRLPYFDRLRRTETGESLPWHVSKFAEDASRMRLNSNVVHGHLRTNNTTYGVLAVENVNGISYRRGIGTIDLSLFHRANPEERYIILG